MLHEPTKHPDACRKLGARKSKNNMDHVRHGCHSNQRSPRNCNQNSTESGAVGIHSVMPNEQCVVQHEITRGKLLPKTELRFYRPQNIAILVF